MECYIELTSLFFFFVFYNAFKKKMRQAEWKKNLRPPRPLLKAGQLYTNVSTLSFHMPAECSLHDVCP